MLRRFASKSIHLSNQDGWWGGTLRCVLLAGCCVVGVVGTGCRGRAQRDVYSQKMAREIRLLEDQLYEADYENRVLMEKLRRAKTLAAQNNAPAPSSQRKPGLLQGLTSPQNKQTRLPDPVVDPDITSQKDPLDLDEVVDGPEFIDPGMPDDFSPREDIPKPLEDPVPDLDQPNGLSVPDTDANQPSGGDDKKQDLDVGNGFDLDSMIDPGEPFIPDSDPGSLLPAPTQPVPPGPSDLQFDPVVPGDVVPPSSPSGKPEDPPGKIDLPPGLGMLGGLGSVPGAPAKIELYPAKIQVNPKVSTPKFISDLSSLPAPPANPDYPPTEGIDVVLDSVDQFGHGIALLGGSHDPLNRLASADQPRPTSLPKSSESTIVSVVVLDANKTGDDAKLGRWDFKSDQLLKLQQMSAVDLPRESVRLPIRWKEKRPTGEKVVVFVRLKQGERDIRCDIELDLRSKASVAGWLPRR